jgi:hypothetical protein
MLAGPDELVQYGVGKMPVLVLSTFRLFKIWTRHNQLGRGNPRAFPLFIFPEFKLI